MPRVGEPKGEAGDRNKIAARRGQNFEFRIRSRNRAAIP
jgi:hypothetical protein